MDWALIQDTGITVAVAIAGVATISGLLLAWRRRRGTVSSGGVEPTVQDILDAYAKSHPAFHRIMVEFQSKYDVDEVLTQQDARVAFQVLEEGSARAAKDRPHQSGSFLHLTQHGSRESPPKVEAAMLTILRSIYMDERLHPKLSAAAHAELDRMLDVLP